MEIVNKTKLHKERYEAALRKVYKGEGIKSLTEHYQHFLDTHGYETDTVSFLKKYGDIPLKYVAFQVRLHRYFDEEYGDISRKYSVSR